MLNRIRSLLGMADGRIGYVYAAEGEAGPMQRARAGAIVRLPDRGPPWIVVDFDLSKIVIARWPGKLWRVRAMEAASRRDQAAVGGPPNDQAAYIRAISVEIVAAENPCVLFGPHGAELPALFDRAAQLTHADAEALAKARAPDAAAAYGSVMRRWAEGRNIPVPPGDLNDALLVGGGSPVNRALTVLHRIISDRAHALDGANASIVLDDEAYLAEPWASAAQVMLHAALALGAPHAVEGGERAALLAGWRSVSD